MAASATLLMSAGFSLFAGLLYFVVGRVSSQRHTAREDHLAHLAFTVWWYSLGATAVVGGLTTFAGAFGRVDVPLLLTLTFALLAVICVALWGLLYYLIYIFFGTRSIAWPLAGMYFAYYAYLVYVILLADPIGVETRRWSIRLDYANDLEGDPIAMLLLWLLVLPQILGALAYGTLYFRTADPRQRYRIALISIAIFAWFGSSLVAGSAGISSSDTWQVVSRLIGLAATLTVLAAYVPPRFIKQRLDSRTAMQAATPS